MRTRAWIASAVLIVAIVSSAPARPEGVSTPDRPTLADRYVVNGDKTQVVSVTRPARDVCIVVGKGWDGVGLLSGPSYWGVFRQTWGSDSSALAPARGTHRGVLRKDGTLAVHGEYTSGLTGSFDVVWVPEGMSAPPAPPAPDRLPEPGDFPYVEELPEALTKVAPVYPEAARRAGVEGTVIVQALVGVDGRVRNTTVIKSIPGLDDAALEAVRQWVFKPASTGGKPVAVWVAVPVRFPPP